MYNEFPTHVSFPNVPSLCTDFPVNVSKDWIRVEFRMLNWKFMNFNKLMRAVNTVQDIAGCIEERHGKIFELRLFLSPPSLKTEILDNRLKLRDLGFKGALKHAPEEVLLYYDYKVSSTDPLLNFSTTLESNADKSFSNIL